MGMKLTHTHINLETEQHFGYSIKLQEALTSVIGLTATNPMSNHLSLTQKPQPAFSSPT